jgi:hypothetical protein
MPIYSNGVLIPENVANALMVNGVNITQVMANGVAVWTQMSFEDVPWTALSYSTCANQHPGLYYTFTTQKEWLHNSTPINISNNGLLWQSSVTNDANNICRTQFIFSFLGYTYKVVNETKAKYVQRKLNGAEDSTYNTITAGAQTYNGYTYLTINVNWSSSVYIGTNGVLDMAQLDGMNIHSADKHLAPIYFYAKNNHNAGCTSAYLYALTFN